MQVSVIIVSFNTAELTVAAVMSADQAITQLGKLQPGEIIVVDNGSTDQTINKLDKLATRNPLQVLKQTHNLGFGQANNLAAKQARGKYLLLLNSDAQLKPGALSAMLTTLENKPHLGAVTVRLTFPSGQPQAQGGDLPSWVSIMTHYLMLDDLPLVGTWLPSLQHTGQSSRRQNRQSDLQIMGWIAGTVFCIHRNLFLQLTGFSDQYHMYFEDIELCARLQKMGKTVAVIHSAEAVHAQAQSSDPTQALRGEQLGLWQYWSTDHSLGHMYLLKTVLMMGNLLRWAIFATINQSSRAKFYLKLAQEIRHASYPH